MLKRFRVNNFKSLLNFEFRPTALNLLVGRNNAGKTNLCSSLRFVSLSSQTSLESAILSAVGETWNLTNVHVAGNHDMEFEVDCSLIHETQPLDFSYRLKLNAPPESSVGPRALRVAEEILIVTGGPFKQMILLENRNRQVRMLHEEGFVQKHPNSPYYVETGSPEDATMLSRLYELKDNPRAALFKRYLGTWLYYSFSTAALRSPDVLRDYSLLRDDGANLSRAMFTLHNEKPRVERKIIEMLKPVEPNTDLFSYSSPDPEHVYMFLEDERSQRFGARSMSDGTLRFLAMVYLLVVLDERSRDGAPTPLIMIEEPENGLYVGHLKPLLQRTNHSVTGGQFIFTTHSPYFIDLFDSCLEGVHLVKPGVPSSEIKMIDICKTRELLKEMSLGEMHFREMLG
ncbi:MAG: AAA family ATPase [Sedimentisphaerales bacterium]|nr:AAA family ATPase [Sedimentisphaerales bacterium]